MINNFIKDFICHKNDSINDILVKINKNKQGIVFLTDNKNYLLGSITDGDIRRCLLKKKKLLINKLANTSPFSLTKNAKTETIAIHIGNNVNKRKFRCIPLVDENNRIVDIATIDNFRRFPLVKPNIDKKEIFNVVKCLETGWISSVGSYVGEFEKGFKKLLGGGHPLTTSSGTTALELALKAMNIGKNDEVIVPNLTFGATINAVINVGATPVIVDTNDEWLIDLNLIRKYLSIKTKAIIPVHLYGQYCDIKKIRAISGTNIKIIEDAAEALGAKLNKDLIGLEGDCSCFSFFANKNITTGEGGMAVFKSIEDFNRAKLIKNHGMSGKKFYFHEVAGNNYRLTNLQCAIGVAQLSKFSKMQKERKNVFLNYNKYFSINKNIQLMSRQKNLENSYWLYTILFKNNLKDKRDQIMQELLNYGIESRPGFSPLNKQPAYLKYAKGSYEKSEIISKNLLSLPTTGITSLQQKKIIDFFLKIIKKYE
jgi:perosamine synthetase